MRLVTFLAFPLLLAAAPALATGGFDCRATDGSGLRLGGTVGHVIASPLVAARLQVGRRTLSTTGDAPEVAIGRSWIDAREIRVDLVDRSATRFEAQLRARILRRGGANGTLLRGGRTHMVHCEVE